MDKIIKIGIICIGLFMLLSAIPSRTEVIHVPQTQKETLINTIVRVAKEEGIKPSHLLGQAMAESSIREHVIGDGGCSKGVTQINICANPQAKSVIGNTEAELRWTADKLKSYGYDKGYITLAFAKYNAPRMINYKYAKSVLNYSKDFTQYDN